MFFLAALVSAGATQAQMTGPVPSSAGMGYAGEATPSQNQGTSTFTLGTPRTRPALNQAGTDGDRDGNGALRPRSDRRAGADDPRSEERPAVRELDPLVDTEYQRFIEQTTGRRLPLYGYNLFAGADFQSLKNVPVPSDYVLGPGDEVQLKVWGAVDGDMRLVVDRNGQITIPSVGTVNLAGVRASQLESLLRGQIRRVYNSFQISATLGQLRSMQVYVVGQARRPGAYTVSSLSTLIGALFESGGPSASGSMRNIQLKRDGRLVSRIDLYKFINEGDKTADTRLLPGDVILIPPAGPRVALTGALDTPAIYELVGAEEPLARVLSYGGGPVSLTTPHKVLIERIDPSRRGAARVVEERVLDAAGLTGTLRDGDVVTLFKISPQFANAVTLRGNVSQPLRHAFKPGMRISDLIPDRDALITPDYYIRRNMLVQFEAARKTPEERSQSVGKNGLAESGRRISDDRVQNEVKNALDEINWDYAVIERLDRDQIRSQLIPFNLGKAVIEKDPANNLALVAGDVVTIFGVKDLPVPVSKRTQYVRLAGEVQTPGVYQLTPGETLEQVVQRAGGFSPNAYPYGTVFTRESTRVQQQKNLEHAIRRMEADINSQGIAAMQNAREGKGEQLQANLEAQRSMIARLRTLRSTGRIALELDPKTNILPPVVLEDGDQITVPNVLSFVGVFGAVQAETSFLHRYNFTVTDYVKRAGPTRDADPDYVAIIRADGSVESNESFGKSWFASWGGDVTDRRLNPGDTVFVPEKFDKRSRYTIFLDGVKDWTTILYQFGLGAAGLKVLRD